MGDVKTLVTKLAESMGLDSLSFGENDIASIQFDDLVVNIHVDQNAEELTLFMRIGIVPSDPAARLAAYAFLLKTGNFASHTGGGVFGVDDTEEGAYFSRRLLAGGMSAGQLEGIVEAFLNLGDSFVADFRAATDSADSRNPKAALVKELIV